MISQKHETDPTAPDITFTYRWSGEYSVLGLCNVYAKHPATDTYDPRHAHTSDVETVAPFCQHLWALLINEHESHTASACRFSSLPKMLVRKYINMEVVVTHSYTTYFHHTCDLKPMTVDRQYLQALNAV